AFDSAAFGGVDFSFFGAAFFWGAAAGVRFFAASLRRAARSFFFTCALRRFIFIELRRSNLPMGAGPCRGPGPQVNQNPPFGHDRRGAIGGAGDQPVDSATWSSRLRTSRRYRLLIVSM